MYEEERGNAKSPCVHVREEKDGNTAKPICCIVCEEKEGETAPRKLDIKFAPAQANDGRSVIAQRRRTYERGKKNENAMKPEEIIKSK